VQALCHSLTLVNICMAGSATMCDVLLRQETGN
jgi:hypothetical protein